MAQVPSPSNDMSPVRALLAPDRLSAQLHVPGSFPHDLLTPSLCAGTAQQAGIELNDDVHRAIDQIIHAAAQTDEAITMPLAIASQTIHGEDGRIQWHVDQDTWQRQNQPADPEPKAEENSQEQEVDHYNRSAFILVYNGDVVGQIHRPILGEDGRDVTGKALPAKIGKEAKLKLDDTLILDATGNIIAQFDGVLERSDGAASIRQNMEIDGCVDFSTGNIDFNGDVMIRKGVRDCFTVRALGCVEVQGLIEAATIIAGKDLTALGGFAGREQGIVNVGNDLKAKYLDSVRGQVQYDLLVDREVVNCHLVVHGCLNAPNGTLIGGQLTVTQKIHAAQIGSPAGTPTEIVLGSVPRYEPFALELAELVEHCQKHHEQLLEEQDQLNKLTAHGRATGIDKERQTELLYDLAQAQRQLCKSQPVLHNLEQAIEEQRTVNVIVERKLCPNVQMIFNGQRFTIRDLIKGPVHISLGDRGQLALSQRGQEGQPLAKLADIQAIHPPKAA